MLGNVFGDPGEFPSLETKEPSIRLKRQNAWKKRPLLDFSGPPTEEEATQKLARSGTADAAAKRTRYHEDWDSDDLTQRVQEQREAAENALKKAEEECHKPKALVNDLATALAARDAEGKAVQETLAKLRQSMDSEINGLSKRISQFGEELNTTVASMNENMEKWKDEILEGVKSMMAQFSSGTNQLLAELPMRTPTWTPEEQPSRKCQAHGSNSPTAVQTPPGKGDAAQGQALPPRVRLQQRQRPAGQASVAQMLWGEYRDVPPDHPPLKVLTEIPSSGDPLIPVDDNTFRVVHFNKNGINLADDEEEIAQEMQFLAENDIACWGMCEPNLNLAQRSTRGTAGTWLKSSWTSSKLTMASSGEWTRLSYQPGGTAMAVIGKWVARVAKTGTDRYGRWVWTRMRERNGRMVTFIEMYHVCNGYLGSAGKGTVWKQMQRALRKDGVVTPNPRRQHVKDLTAFIQGEQELGHLIHLMGDFNEKWDHGRGGMNKLWE